MFHEIDKLKLIGQQLPGGTVATHQSSVNGANVTNTRSLSRKVQHAVDGFCELRAQAATAWRNVRVAHLRVRIRLPIDALPALSEFTLSAEGSYPMT